MLGMRGGAVSRRQNRPPGTGSVYRRAGVRWCIRWGEGGRRRYASGFPTRVVAEHVLRKVLADLAAGRAELRPDPTSTGPDVTIAGAAAVIAGLLTDDPTAEDARAAARAWVRAFEDSDAS